MELTALLSSLDSLFAEKRFRYQKSQDVVSFAKFTDSTCQFAGGYLFTGTRHMHRPNIFMGVYTCNNRTLLHLSCLTKLMIPQPLQPTAHDFFNSLNLASKGLWGVYCNNQVRFHCSHLLPASNLKSLVWLLMQKTDAWFKETIGKFVEWMKTDPVFLKNVRQYQEEFAYFTRVMPRDTVQEITYRDMSDQAQIQLKALGFSRYSLLEKYGKILISFTLTNEGTSTGQSWKMFPVLITLGPALFEIKIVFMMNEQWIQFSDPTQVDTLCTVLAFANERVKVGFFTYDSEKKNVYLHAKSPYCLIDKKDFGNHLEKTLAICISSYKLYAYGFVELYGKSPIEQIFKKCTERERYFQQREINKKREMERQEESSDPATDEHSDSDSSSSDSDKEDEESPHQQRLLNQPLSEVDFSLAELFRGKLPAALQAFFCLSAKELDAQKLIDWKFDDRLQREQCVRKVVDGFIRMRRERLLFKKLPFDSATLNLKGDLVLLPTFHPDNFEVLARPFDIDQTEEEKLKFDITAEMLPFLARRISKDKYTTLANFKVFRSMQDVDYIPPTKFRKVNLAHEDNLIGSGGFGLIYRNEMDGIEVALKTIKPERAMKKPSREYLKKEFRLTQACSHPNVVRIYGYTKFEERLFLVMEYCSNGGLSRYLHSHNLPLKDKVRILLQVADGMTLVHAKNICHFDLKPQNILLTDNFEPKICDFGLSQVWSPERPCRKVGLTMMYASPEQVAKNEPGPPADVWAFGILIYYTIFCKHPFEYIREKFGRTDHDRKRIYEEIAGRRRKPLFTKDFEKQQPKLVHLIRSCLAFDAAQRPKFVEIVADLEAINKTL